MANVTMSKNDETTTLMAWNVDRFFSDAEQKTTHFLMNSACTLYALHIVHLARFKSFYMFLLQIITAITRLPLSACYQRRD